MVSCGDQATLLQGVPTYQQLSQAIELVSKGAMQPHAPQASLDGLRTLLAAHSLISLVELATAFDLASTQAAEALAQPLIETGEVIPVQAPKGRFLSATGVGK